QFAHAAAGRTKRANRIAVTAKDLNTVVAGVGNIEVAVRPQRQGPCAREFAGTGARTAPALDERAVGSELGNPAVLAKFRHIVITVGVLYDVADVTELSGLRSG